MQRSTNPCGSRTLLAATSSLFAIFVALLLPSLAHATNDKSYPATSCRKADGSGGVLGTRNDGSVENDSPVQSLVVVCPIVRDHTDTTDPWTINVRVHDQSPQAVSCTASSLTEYSVALVSATAQTSAPNTGLGTLTMSPPGQPSDGHSVLQCTLPPANASGVRSKLLAYVVREPDGTPAGYTDTKNYSGTYAEIFVAAGGVAPFIAYPALAQARPRNAGADDKWILPVIRDSTLSKWERVRFRFKDSDGDKIVSCLVFNMNENGTTNGIGATGMQDFAPGDATALAQWHPNNNVHTGPIAIQCDRIQTDILATRYDIREWLDF